MPQHKVCCHFAMDQEGCGYAPILIFAFNAPSSSEFTDKRDSPFRESFGRDQL